MALFADNLVVGIVRFVRRELRLGKIRKWPTTDAEIQRFRSIEGEWHGLRPVIDYTYKLNGEQYHGSATGRSRGDGMMEMGDSIDAMIAARTLIHIRADPADPGDNYMLNGDNPGFAFHVDDDLL